MLLAGFALLGFLGAFAACKSSRAQAVSANANATYACPMHPEMTGKKGDKCAKCGMDMQPIKHDAEMYACSMHPEMTGKKGDKCAKCSMAMQPIKHDAETYACPMHPEMTGKKGDKCAKCGMDMKPMKH